MTRSLETGVAMAWLALAACAFVSLRAPLLDLPLERDEGEYATIAWRMQEGDVPYRDAFDQKPPGVFGAYWLAFTLLGRDAASPRLLLHGWLLVGAAALWLWMRSLAGPLAAAFAVLVLAVASADPRLGAATANTELFLVPALIIALGCALHPRATARAGPWFVAGAASGLAVAFKQVAATNALYLVLLAAVLHAPGGRAARFGALVAGGLAVVAPIVAWFAWQGALGEFVDAVLLHNFSYAARRSWGEGFSSLAHALSQQAPSLAGVWGLATLGLAMTRDEAPRARPLLGGWLLVSLLGVAIGWQFRPHYFVQALPALAACAGLGAAALYGKLATRSATTGAVAAALMALGVVAAPALANRAVLFAESPRAAARAIWGLNPFPEAERIARHIAATSAPDESVYVVGSEAQIFFLAERPSATRYIFFYPLTGGYEKAAERQREVIRDVESARPRFVVWVNVATSLLANARTDRYVFERSEALLARDYAIELVAHPNETGDDYVLARGASASAWLTEHRDELGVLPWVGVYRRGP